MAKEIECAVIGSGQPFASLPGELSIADEFYDYDAKYVNGTSKTIIPANLDFELLDDIRMVAIKVYTALGVAGMARIDFFLEHGTNRILLNELNTIPGFTDISMYPKMLDASGMDFSMQLDRLIELAFEHREQRSALKR